MYKVIQRTVYFCSEYSRACTSIDRQVRSGQVIDSVCMSINQ